LPSPLLIIRLTEILTFDLPLGPGDNLNYFMTMAELPKLPHPESSTPTPLHPDNIAASDSPVYEKFPLSQTLPQSWKHEQSWEHEDERLLPPPPYVPRLDLESAPKRRWRPTRTVAAVLIGICTATLSLFIVAWALSIQSTKEDVFGGVFGKVSCHRVPEDSVLHCVGTKNINDLFESLGLTAKPQRLH